MSVDQHREPAQATDTERRSATGDRVPFEGIVEVGGALGPSFEAQAIDVSAEGIHLRTAYLPELGQPLTCRLELGKDVVLAAGEVAWRQEAERGGEFGMRFTDLDPQSEAALKKLVSVEPTFAAQTAGSRVRLHIDGLGSPMRARIKGSAAEGLVVGSELGFLQVGKELELEDATTGGKRSARIHRVGVEINPETQIPQLVVSLRYDVTDADVPVSTEEGAVEGESTPEPSVLDDEKDEKIHHTARGLSPRDAVKPRAVRAREALDDEPFGPMRSGVGEVIQRASAKVGPALSRLGAQARTTLGLVAEKARNATKKEAPETRRTTAPPPGGGLHATGRKVVRTEVGAAAQALSMDEPSGVTKRRMAVGSAVLLAFVLAFASVHKASPPAQALSDVAPSAVAAGGPAGNAAGAGTSPSASATTPLAPNASNLAPPPGLAPLPPEEPSTPPQSEDRSHHGKALHVTPFGSGAVGHANVLHLKMDGVIEKIEGATTPTGFTVVIPDRRSLEAAAPLAARDSRIGAIRITNEANGAELAVSFKDGVPNYLVRAKGDSLEILLAPQGKLTDTDDTKPTKRRHTKH